MTRSLLVRGMLVGLAAGVTAFVVASIFGEPHVQHAIDFEAGLAHAHHAAGEHELVSRDMQSSLGLLTGTAFLGLALGGLFALVYAYAYGRIGDMSPRLTALVLAAAAYVTIVLVPFTKYPASPPTFGSPDTVGQRTVLYLVMIAISLVAAVAAWRIRRSVVGRLGAWNAGLVAGGVFLVVIGVAQLVLPAVHETPAGFPADVLYRFRLASLGVSLTLWTVIGLGFGFAAERVLAPVLRRASEGRADVSAPVR